MDTEIILIIIIGALLLVLISVVSIVKSIFRHGGGHGPTYHQLPPGYAHEYPQQSMGPSGFFFLILLLIFGIVYFFPAATNENRGGHVSTPPAVGEEKERDLVNEGAIKLNFGPEEQVLEPTPEITQEAGSNLPAAFFAVQLCAFASFANAKSAQEKLREELGRYDIHVMTTDEDSPYKVVIAPFEDEDSARQIIDGRRIKGFVTGFSMVEE